MKPIIALNTISKQFTKHPNALMKLEYDINSGAAAGGVFVQIHDFPTQDDLVNGRSAPAAGSVPVKTWPTPAGATNGYKEFKNGELTLQNGCFVCVSTTQATLTIGTVNNKFDSVAAEMWNADLTGTTEVQTTAYKEQVWTEANGLLNDYKLIRVAVTNLDAGVAYLMMFAEDAPTDDATTGSIPIAQWPLAATGDSTGGDKISLNFGLGENGTKVGTTVFSQTSAGVPKRGCSFFLSLNSGRLYSGGGATSMKFYGEYK